MNASDTTPQFAPEIEAALDRMAETLKHLRSDPPPGNDDQAYFFRALARQRWATDHCGGYWEQPLPARQAGQLARTHRKASGVNALASVLMADFETQQCGSEEPQLTPHLREGLFLALTELAGEVHNTLAVIGEHLERTPKGERA